jgi:antitoxin VapB
MGSNMALQIANSGVVRKVEALAKATGLSKTAVVEKAVDRMLAEIGTPIDSGGRMDELLRQMDQVPERADAFDAMAWDAHGLPR